MKTISENNHQLNPAGVIGTRIAERRIDIAIALLIGGLMAALTLAWFSFDHHVPTQDEAAHIFNALDCKGLLAHIHLFRYQWWYRFLTVSPLYPPFVYTVNGALMLVLQEPRFAEQLCMSLFTGLLATSVYAVTRLLHGRRRAACIAGLSVCMYPALAKLSHTFFLDLPEASMTAFGLMILLWWRSQPQMTIARTLLSGAALALACLTKQLVAVYLVPLGLYFLITDLITALRPQPRGADIQRFKRLIHTFCLGMIAALIGSPFIIINYQWNKDRVLQNMQAVAGAGLHISYAEKLGTYFHYFPYSLSLPLLIIFIISILCLRRRDYSLLFPVILSAIGGLGIVCALPAEAQDYRYLAPFFIAPAIFTGFFMEKLFASTNRWRRVAAPAIIGLAIIDYATFNFSPYPLSLPELPWQSRPSCNPERYCDWGYESVLQTINKIDGKRFVTLNLLTNHDALNPQIFRLVLREEGNINVMPTSSRSWSICGDKVSPLLTPWFIWCLWKTGSTGYKFYDRQSEKNFAQLVSYVRNGNNYQLIMQRPLPDGSQLMLYRRKF